MVFFLLQKPRSRSLGLLGFSYVDSLVVIMDDVSESVHEQFRSLPSWSYARYIMTISTQIKNDMKFWMPLHKNSFINMWWNREFTCIVRDRMDRMGFLKSGNIFQLYERICLRTFILTVKHLSETWNNFRVDIHKF